MKKILAVLFVLMQAVSVACAQSEKPSVHEIAERSYTFYNGYIDDPWSEPVPLYFMDGVDDLPMWSWKTGWSCRSSSAGIG